MITSKQIALVQETWQSVVPIKEVAANLFYEKLFELNPDLRLLFKGDMAEQRSKLMMMLNTAVLGLSRLDNGTLVTTLQRLGNRHEEYGVRAEDYDTVGAALLWTLEQGLGSAFTSEVRLAWTAVYGLIASTMQTRPVSDAGYSFDVAAGQGRFDEASRGG